MNEWLAPVAPARRLAALRILVGTFSTVYLIARAGEFRTLSRQPDFRFEPVGIVSWLDSPPDPGLVTALLVAAILSGVAFTLGWRFRLSGPLNAALWMILGTFHSSWGQLLHFEHLIAIHVAIIGLSPAAAAWSVDGREAKPDDHSRYGFPLRLAALATVLTYMLAAVAKLRESGVDWITDDALRNHIGYTATRLRVLGEEPAPLAELVDWVPWLFPWLAAAAVLLELAAPAAFLGRRWATAWVIPVVMMHVGIVATMWIFFPYQTLGFAFLPFFPIEKWIQNALGRFGIRVAANEI